MVLSKRAKVHSSSPDCPEITGSHNYTGGKSWQRNVISALNSSLVMTSSLCGEIVCMAAPRSVTCT